MKGWSRIEAQAKAMSSSINTNSFTKPLTSAVVYFTLVRITIYPQMYISPPTCQGLLKTVPKILENCFRNHIRDWNRDISSNNKQ